jgi:hypothetical protein
MYLRRLKLQSDHVTPRCRLRAFASQFLAVGLFVCHPDIHIGWGRCTCLCRSLPHLSDQRLQDLQPRRIRTNRPPVRACPTLSIFRGVPKVVLATSGRHGVVHCTQRVAIESGQNQGLNTYCHQEADAEICARYLIYKGSEALLLLFTPDQTSTHSLMAEKSTGDEDTLDSPHAARKFWEENPLLPHGSDDFIWPGPINRKDTSSSTSFGSILPWITTGLLFISTVFLVTKPERQPACPFESRTYCKCLLANISHRLTAELHISAPVPVDEAIEYVPVQFKAGFGDQNPSEYQGWPNDAKDALWEQLSSRMYLFLLTRLQYKPNYIFCLASSPIPISQASESRLVTTTEHAPIAGREDDYLVAIAVFHQLHCLVSSS